MPTDPQHSEELERALEALGDQWRALGEKEERDCAFHRVMTQLGKRSITAALALNRAYQILRPRLEPTEAGFIKVLATVARHELEELLSDFGAWRYMYGFTD